MNRLMRLKNRKANRKGFTLVELIVVLVILAILAAILIPALLGWIDRAREKKDLLAAKNALTAIQACLTEEYAKNSFDLKEGTNAANLIVPAKNNGNAVNSNGDVNATGTVASPNPFQDRVLNTIDQKTKSKNANNENDTDDPVVIIFGVGSNVSDKKVQKCTIHEKYTVYYLMYQQTVDSDPLFYFNGTWTTVNPRTDSTQIKDKYYPQVGPLNGKRIQYYIVSNKLIEKLKGRDPKASKYTGASKEFWEYVDSFNK